MNCKEFQEQISPAVDRYLKGSKRALFDDHARGCLQCQRSYEGELQTKTLIQSRIQMTPTPQILTARILSLLGEEQLAGPRVWPLTPSLLLHFPSLRISFGVAFVVVFLFATQPVLRFWETPQPLAFTTDVISQSHANYEAMIGGGMRPQMASAEPDLLSGFFAGKTDFPVHVPAMKKCQLVGGGLEEVRGMKFAHVMYQGSGGAIYICQMCFESAMKGERLSLPEDARRRLQQTGWYTQTLPDGDVLVLWTRGATLCAAVAHMSSDDLIAALTSDEKPRW